MSYRETYNFWLEDDYFDQDTKNELLAIRNNEEEIEDRFYRDLEFGTGGLRGVIGAGTNRMNYLHGQKGNTGSCQLYHQGRAVRKKAWRSHMIPEDFHRNLHWKQPSA